MNRHNQQETRPRNPISIAPLWSKLTFWWLKPVFRVGLRREIEENDIYAVTNSMRSDQNTEEFAKLWQLELEKKNPSILNVMLKLHGFKVFTLSILFSVGYALGRLIMPICLGGFVSYFAQTDDTHITSNDAYWYAAGIVLSMAYTMITFHPFVLCMFKTSCQIRVACSGLIYKKVLRISKSSTEDGQSGQIINLLSNDLLKLDDGLTYLYDLWKGPLEAFIFFIVIYMNIGTAAFVGIAFLASFIPLQAWIGRRSAQLQMNKSIRTDFRIKIMNEILAGIQVIKMYAWEKSFAKMVDQIRKKEVNAIRSIAYIRATISSFAMISKVSIFLSLVSYVYFGNVITARKVFIVSSYFSMLNYSMVYVWPVALTYIAQTYVSIKRLQEFLLKPESKHSMTIKEEQRNEIGNELTETAEMKLLTDEVHHKRVHNINSNEKSIRLEKATAVWECIESHQMNGIYDMNIEITTGLCTIIGAVGSGKSTLLNVILGELELDMGSITVNGTISYASQEPWLFGGSVRSNIVFVEDFDEQRYHKVVEVCALERDFKLLPDGDETIVGEQGSSLSGGQKARINLARAIYKRSDIYLLDDPLSAVDTHVGKHIFEKCINDFLAEKMCVLVTHQLQYLKNVNHVILLNNGKIEAEGPFKTLQRFNKESLINVQEENDQNVTGAIQNQIRKNASSVSFCDDEIEDNSNNRKELLMTGRIKFSTYKDFFQAVHNSVFVFIVFIVFIASQFAWSGSDYFLSEWVNWEETVIKTDSVDMYNKSSIMYSANVSEIENNVETTTSGTISQKREIFLAVYACIMVFGTICYLFRSFSFHRMCLRISINMHDMIFRGVTRAKMIFFNNNSSGRILNRFARDINSVDSLLPTILVDIFDCFLNYLAIIVINCTVNPWLLIPSTLMMVIFYFLRNVYINTGRSFKRIEALSRSPIFTHMNSTLQGLATVRAFNAGIILEREFHEFQDHNTSCFYLFIHASRWFALSLDLMCLLFIAIVIYSFLLLENAMDLQSGQVGLAILSSISLVGTCQWGMRQSAELESQMTSVERIIEYAKLPSEPPLESTDQSAPLKDWPHYGNIEFKSLSMRYAENGARVLRHLTFQIDAKQKIGVVGRTGAGKSSIIQSIFRLAQNEGQILIDGIDISTIGLHDLRKKISIIPQEAVLFSGNLRFNLDPFAEKNDDELWNALDQVELKSMVSALPDGIDSKVADGGMNFSAGQRQLFCLARAILRNNKILILDEATSNCDSDTDKLIQQTIRKIFDDCTVITIAHRLHTVMDSDKVLVVDAGKIVEFDHPFELIQKSDGFFKQLLDQTGSSTAAALTLAAKESYDKNQSK